MQALLFAMLAAIVSASPALAQSGAPPVRKEIVYVEPTEDDYVGMILAATAWAKRDVSKSLGVLQRAEAAPAWTKGIAAAAKRHDLKTIELDDFTVVCFTRSASRSAPMSRVCSMKGAEAVLQFNTVKVAGGSGAMLTTVTRVPKGGSRTETTHYCLQLARKGAEWEALRTDRVEDPDRCIEARLPELP